MLSAVKASYSASCHRERSEAISKIRPLLRFTRSDFTLVLLRHAELNSASIETLKRVQGDALFVSINGLLLM